MPLETSPSFTRRHKLLFGVIITVGVLLYAAFNLWVWRWSNRGKVPSPTAPRQTLKPSGKSARLNPTESALTATPPAKQDPAPRDTPRLTGSGNYACSLEGICNVYSDETRNQYCTTTYADNKCLDQCGDKAKRCTK